MYVYIETHVVHEDQGTSSPLSEWIQEPTPSPPQFMHEEATSIG